MSYPSRSRQQGMALIMAVLIAALAVTAVAFAAWRQQVRLRDAEVRADSAAAQLLLRASITIARTALIDDLRHDKRNYSVDDHPGEELFTHREDTDVEMGHARGHIEDASGRFNLNELLRDDGGVDETRVGTYEALVSQLGLDAALVPALVDWIDGDEEMVPGGAEDLFYLARQPPYRTANAGLGDLSELMYVRGYTAEVIEKLRPHVDVFPRREYDLASGGAQGAGTGTINVNFCTPEVLMAVFRGVMDKAVATTILNEIKHKPYLNINDFMSRLPDKALQKKVNDDPVLKPAIEAQLDARSRYFYAVVALDYGRVRWSERVLLRRVNDDSTPRSVEVLRRVRLAE